MDKVLITGGCSFSDSGEGHRRTWPTYIQKKYKFNKFVHTGQGASGNELITHRLLHSIDKVKQLNYKKIYLAVMWSEIERNDIFTDDLTLSMDTDNGDVSFLNIYNTNTIPIDLRVKSGFIRPGGKPHNETWYRNEKQRKFIFDYYKFYNEEYSIMNTLKNIILVQNVCKQNNIKCVMFIMKNIFENIKKYPQINYLYNTVDWTNFVLYNKKYGLYEYTLANDLEFWEDDYHPAYNSHKHFIDNFENEINTLWKTK